MTSNIHHATKAKAEKHGLTINALDDGLNYTVIHDKTGTQIAVAGDPKTALDVALAEWFDKDGNFLMEDDMPAAVEATEATEAEGGTEGTGGDVEATETPSEGQDEATDAPVEGDEAEKLAESAEAEAYEEAAEAEAEKVTKSIVPRRFVQRYRKYGGRCGDDLSEILSAYVSPGGGFESGPYAEVCNANGIDPSRWSGLNTGQKRMNLGNVLRGKLRRGEDVVIGDITIEGEKQDEAPKAA